MKKCNNSLTFLGYEHFINDTDRSKYVVLQNSPGSMSVTMVRHDYLLPVKRAGFINHTQDGNVTIGDLTCDNKGGKILNSFGLVLFSFPNNIFRSGYLYL